MIQKKLAAGILAAAAAFSAFAGGKKDAAAAAAAGAAPAPRVIKAGSTGQSYPNGFKENGKLVGYDVEIMEAIASELGYTVEWTVAEFAGIMGQLDTGRLDTVANLVSITPAREEKYAFTSPYIYAGCQIVTHTDNTDINSIPDLYGKTVAGVLGSNNTKVLQETFPNGEVTIKTFETRDVAMQELKLKRVAGYANTKSVLLAEIKRSNLPFKLVGNTLSIESCGFPFAKTEDGRRLRDEAEGALSRLRERGVLRELAVKYFGDDVTKDPRN